LLATANAARGGAPAWSAPELFTAAQAEGLATSIGAVRTALADVLKPHGLVERANVDTRDSRDVALRLTNAVRGAARSALCYASLSARHAFDLAQGRTLAAQHGVAVAPPVDGPLPERQLGRRPGWNDQAPPDDGRVRISAPGPAAARGRWLYFRLLAKPNPSACNRAEWRATELSRAAGAALGRRTSVQAAAAGLKALGRMGLAERAYVNTTAPWALTNVGVTKACELGVLPPMAPSVRDATYVAEGPAVAQDYATINHHPTTTSD
jgi:hypothetical protein